MLSPANLRAFTAVVEEGTFTAAAERLNATQSGVSQQVAKLERHLGVTLLVRGSQRASPTPAGRQLYLRSIAILRDLAATETALKAFRHGIAGSIVVGLMPAMTRCLSGPLQRQFMTDHPNVRIELTERISSDLIAAVTAGQIDFAIVPAFNAPDAIRCRPIGTTGEVLVHRGLRHASHMRWVTLAELSPIRLILQPAGNLRRERILTSLKAAQVEVLETLDLDSTLATLEFVEHSDFAAILPAMTMAPEMVNQALCVRPIRSQSLRLDLIAIEPSRRERSPIAELLAVAFADSIRQVNRTVATLSRRSPAR
jgi:LysR family nitrogen assimilation transcriptional regulator